MVRLWWATVAGGTDRSPTDISLLSPDETARMLRYHREADRDRFAVAWSMTRRVLGEITGVDPRALAFDRRCAHCGNPAHGKPHLVGLAAAPDFSISHAGGRVVLAVVETGLVGVDVESVTHDVDELARLILHPAEPVVTGIDLLRVWVRKEAVLKATGHGIARPMVDVNLGDLPNGMDVRDVATDDGYVAATATAPAPARPGVRIAEAAPVGLAAPPRSTRTCAPASRARIHMRARAHRPPGAHRTCCPSVPPSPPVATAGTSDRR